ncbi:MAG: 30S ribosomal protein S3ae [Candidatus Hydrothermarchaeales archaeon]
MARARRLRKADTWKTKKWVDIVAPNMFGEVNIGETFSSDPSTLTGRVIETTMRDITGDFSKQHIQLRFQIVDVVGDTAHTKFVMHSLSRAYMRSQIRRKMTRVEGIQDITTRDGYKLRVKTIALAAGRAQTAQEKLLRKLMNSMVKKQGSRTNFEVFIQETVLGKLPAMIYRAANKAYPVRRVEIKKIKLLEEPHYKKKREAVKPEVKKKEEPKPKVPKIEKKAEKKESVAEPPKTRPAPEKPRKVKEEPEKKVEKEVKTEKKTEKKAELPKEKTATKKKETVKEKPKQKTKKKTKPKTEKKETKKEAPKEKKQTKAKSKKKAEKKK